MNLNDRIRSGLPESDQTEIPGLLSEANPSDQQKIQKLSSEISELKSIIAELKTELSDTQKLNQTLVNNNQLLTQSNDDLRNRSGLMLRKEQKELKDRLCIMEARISEDKKEYERKVKEANRRADIIEKRCAVDNEAAAKARKEAESFRNELKRLLLEEKKQIDALATQKISHVKKQLKETREKELSMLREKRRAADEKYRNFYKAKFASHENRYRMIFFFCILWLIILAVTSSRFFQDFTEVGSWIYDYFSITGSELTDISLSASSVSELIHNESLSVIVFWIIRIGTSALLGALFYVAPIAGIAIGITAYLRSIFFDSVNRWIMAGSSILIVALASCSGDWPPINLILLWLIIQVTVPVIRGILVYSAYKASSKAS